MTESQVLLNVPIYMTLHIEKESQYGIRHRKSPKAQKGHHDHEI